MKLKELIFKYRKVIIAFAILLFILLITAIFLITKDKGPSIAINIPPISFPVVSLSQPTVIRDGYNFTNKAEFKFNKLDNLDQNFCMQVSFPERPPVTIDIDYYIYQNGDNSMPAKVINNMDLYLNNGKDIKDTYDLYNKLLNNELTVENAPRSNAFLDTLPRPCDTSGFFVVDLRKIDYPGTDSAYLIVFGGSTQSAVNHTYFPIRMSIISRIGETYSILNNGSIKYDDITNNNNLTLCEEISSNGTPIMEEFTEDGNQCIREQYKNDLDTNKLDNQVNNMLSVFALK